MNKLSLIGSCQQVVMINLSAIKSQKRSDVARFLPFKSDRKRTQFVETSYFWEMVAFLVKGVIFCLISSNYQNLQ